MPKRKRTSHKGSIRKVDANKVARQAARRKRAHKALGTPTAATEKKPPYGSLYRSR